VPGRHTDVGSDCEDFFVTLTLVLTLRKTKTGSRDASECLTPTKQIDLADIGRLESMRAV
jgi:hypothetical protein